MTEINERKDLQKIFVIIQVCFKFFTFSWKKLNIKIKAEMVKK